MDLLTRMSLAIAYVEENLTGDIVQETSKHMGYIPVGKVQMGQGCRDRQ